MPSEEIKKQVRALLQESSDRFQKDFIEVDKYDPEVVALIFESLGDVCDRTAKDLKANNFSTNIDAIDFSGLIIEMLMNTIVRNIKSLALLKRLEMGKN